MYYLLSFLLLDLQLQTNSRRKTITILYHTKAGYYIAGHASCEVGICIITLDAITSVEVAVFHVSTIDPVVVAGKTVWLGPL